MAKRIRKNLSNVVAFGVDSDALDSVLITALSGASKEAPPEFRIFKKGANKSTKGTVYFGEKSAELLSAQIAEDRNNDQARYFIDKNHQMVHASEGANVDADAMAWFELEVRNGELWAVKVEWLPEGKEKVESKKLRYMSPAFRTDSDKNVTQLLNVALTNYPAIRDQPPLAASGVTAPTPENPFMDHAKLCALMGIPVTTSAADVEELLIESKAGKLVALQGDVEKLIKEKATAEGAVTSLSGLLKETGKSTVNEAIGALAALKEKAAKADDLQKQFDGIAEKEKVSVLEALITKGKAANKITNGNEKRLREWAAKHGVEAFSSYLEDMGVAVQKPASDTEGGEGDETEEGGEGDTKKWAGLTPEDRLIAELMPHDYATPKHLRTSKAQGIRVGVPKNKAKDS